MSNWKESKTITVNMRALREKKSHCIIFLPDHEETMISFVVHYMSSSCG